MRNKYFGNVVQVGDLYLDYIFYEFENEPILFICSSEDEKIFLCLCIDIRYGQKWIITECSLETLRSLINKKMDITSAFLTSLKAIMINMDLQGRETSYEINMKDVDPLDLPEEDTFIKCDEKSAHTYLSQKELEKQSMDSEINADKNLFYDRIKEEFALSFNISVSKIERAIELHSEYMDEKFIQSCMVNAVFDGKTTQSKFSVEQKINYIEENNDSHMNDISICDCSYAA